MWIVIKYKKKELNFLRQDLQNILGEIPNIYIPKIKFQKIIKNQSIIFKKELLNDYLFCYNKKFSEINFSVLNYLRGVKYCLSNKASEQKSIISFINICKTNQDNDDCLNQEFFNILDFKKGIFLTGPLTNLLFELVEKHKNKLKVKVGNLSVVINKDSNCLYQLA